MKPFEYVSPRSLAEAVELLPGGRGRRRGPETRLLAGGQDLIGELADHLAEPERVVNLKRIPGLDRIEPGADGGLRVGALATLARLAADPACAGFEALRQAALAVGSPQIRNAGTVGGNLCQRPRCWYFRNEQTVCLKKGGPECFAFSGDNRYNAVFGGGPSYIVHPSDLAPALVALEAEAFVFGPAGESSLPLEEFFTLPSEGSVLRETVLRSNEVLTGVRVPPLPTGSRSAYLKFRERGSYDFALAAVGAVLTLEGDRIARARLCLGAVAPIPWRLREVERLLEGEPPGEALWREAAEVALAGAEPLKHNGYKVPLAKGLVMRVLRGLTES